MARDVLRPLSHVMECWELTWDFEGEKYLAEEGSYAALLNELLKELGIVSPPARYHDSEDRLAEYVIEHLKWPILKVGGRWVGADYDSVIEQGSFHDRNERDLTLAAAGRIRAAQILRQKHYDHMEPSHRRMLAAVLSIILFRRTPDP